MVAGTNLREITFAQQDRKLRLDAFLSETFDDLSRTKIKELITAKNVYVDDRVATKPSLVLNLGQRVLLKVPERQAFNLDPVLMNLNVVFEDESIIVINKPAGLTVHPGAGASTDTLVNGLLAYLTDKNLSQVNGDSVRPGIVHRLDKDTTGLLVCAKDDFSHRMLAKQFHEKTNKREYTALLDGGLTQSKVVCESFLGRDFRNRLRYRSYDLESEAQSRQSPKLKWAKTEFFAERNFANRLTLVKVRLWTGRTHQIRVHAKELGMPIVGDLVYHKHTELPLKFDTVLRNKIHNTNRQMLHAQSLGFVHPRSQKWMEFECPIPQDFSDLVDALGAYEMANT